MKGRSRRRSRRRRSKRSALSGLEIAGVVGVGLLVLVGGSYYFNAEPVEMYEIDRDLYTIDEGVSEMPMPHYPEGVPDQVYGSRGEKGPSRFARLANWARSKLSHSEEKAAVRRLLSSRGLAGCSELLSRRLCRHGRNMGCKWDGGACGVAEVKDALVSEMEAEAEQAAREEYDRYEERMRLREEAREEKQRAEAEAKAKAKAEARAKAKAEVEVKRVTGDSVRYLMSKYGISSLPGLAPVAPAPRRRDAFLPELQRNVASAKLAKKNKDAVLKDIETKSLPFPEAEGVIDSVSWFGEPPKRRRRAAMGRAEWSAAVSQWIPIGSVGGFARVGGAWKLLKKRSGDFGPGRIRVSPADVAAAMRR